LDDIHAGGNGYYEGQTIHSCGPWTVVHQVEVTSSRPASPSQAVVAKALMPPPPVPPNVGHGHEDNFFHISFNTQTQSIEKHQRKQWNFEQNYQNYGAPGGVIYYERALMEGLHENQVLEFKLRARDFEVKRLNGQVNKLETDLEKKANANQIIWEEIEKTKKKEKADAKAFAKMKAKNTRIGNLNHAIHQEMEDLKKTMDKVEQYKKDMSAKLAEAHKQVKAAKKKTAEVQKSLEDLKKTKKELELKTSTAEVRCSNLLSQRDSMNERSEDTERQLNLTRKRFEEQTVEYSLLKAENKVLNNKLKKTKTFQKSAVDAKDKAEDLENELREVTQELEEAEANYQQKLKDNRARNEGLKKDMKLVIERMEKRKVEDGEEYKKEYFLQIDDELKTAVKRLKKEVVNKKQTRVYGHANRSKKVTSTTGGRGGGPKGGETMRM